MKGPPLPELKRQQYRPRRSPARDPRQALLEEAEREAQTVRVGRGPLWRPADRYARVDAEKKNNPVHLTGHRDEA